MRDDTNCLAASCLNQTNPAGTALLISAATLALLSAPGLALAGGFLPPAGVTAYRLAFITSDVTSAMSTLIGDYNTFATNDALASTLGLPSTAWHAIVSTARVSALQNIGCGANCGAALPIYLVNGTTLVGTSITDLFGGTEPNTIRLDQNGVSFGSYVWTGSTAAGGIKTGNEVGAVSGNIEVGGPFFNASLMFDLGGTFSNSGGGASTFPILAISSEIDVPEPATGAALLVAGLMITRVFRPKRQGHLGNVGK